MNHVFVDHEPMPLQQALDLADHASPMPSEAQRALRALRDHITALQVQVQEREERLKRIAEAPCVDVTACNQIPGASDFDYGQLSAAFARFEIGSRVCLVSMADAAPLAASRPITAKSHELEVHRDAVRWRALREMDGGAIHLLLGDYDGMRPELADRALDLYLETRGHLRAALSGNAGTACQEVES